MQRYETIHKPISVFTLNRPGKTLIKAFKWENRVYRITANNLMTKARKGSTPVYLFAVSNSNGAYKLRFDTDTLNWWLEEVLWEE